MMSNSPPIEEIKSILDILIMRLAHLIPTQLNNTFGPRTEGKDFCIMVSPSSSHAHGHA